MGFMLSAGVNVSEYDLSQVVPGVATTDAALAGIFQWGPVGERVLITSEDKLLKTFGPPNSNNAETWFTAANFLSYSNALHVVRAANTTSNNSSYGAQNAYANNNTVTTDVVAIKNRIDFELASSALDGDITYLAKWPGIRGNSLKVSQCDTTKAFTSYLYCNAMNSAVGEQLNVDAEFAMAIGSSSLTLAVTTTNEFGTAADCNVYARALMANLTIGDLLTLGNNTIGYQQVKIKTAGALVTNASGAFITYTTRDPYNRKIDFVANSSITDNIITRHWEFATEFSGAPKNSPYVAAVNNSVVDTMHVIVIDEDGVFSGVPGAILEKFEHVSRATDGKTADGATNYFKTVINNNSDYVWVANSVTSGPAATLAEVSDSHVVRNFTLARGTDGYSEATAPLSIIADAYDVFNTSGVDISLILQGKPIGGTGGNNSTSSVSWQLANYLIDNIAEVRKDCVVFASIDDRVVTENRGNEALAMVEWSEFLHSSSYAVLDSGYKYQYDKYNDVYRWIPLNGDIAGLCARTDSQRDPWWSPAGFNRGQIKNLVKLRWNPGTTADRDALYSSNINPVVTFAGQGTYLYGDKTLNGKSSAFDHINVRRLFIVLEKAIAAASKMLLFEFNDEFTRSQFRNMINPYLRDIQGRRGITDFLVVCDETNNTAERIDRSEFWGDIYIKPARSINFIQLNFIAVRTGVQFSEVVGQY